MSLPASPGFNNSVDHNNPFNPGSDIYLSGIQHPVSRILYLFPDFETDTDTESDIRFYNLSFSINT